MAKATVITEHHPRFRFNILQTLENFIYYPIEFRLMEILEKVIDSNRTLMHSQKNAFWYRGEKWYSVYSSGKKEQNLPRLHESLRSEMDALIAERDHINDVEKPLVNGFLSMILNHSKSVTEMLMVVPVALQAPIQDLLSQLPDGPPTMTIDEVAVVIKAPQAATDALKTRLMKTLLEK